jgi:hypothetical protein
LTVFDDRLLAVESECFTVSVGMLERLKRSVQAACQLCQVAEETADTNGEPSYHRNKLLPLLAAI